MVHIPSLLGALLLPTTLATTTSSTPPTGGQVNPPNLVLGSAAFTSKWFEGSNFVQIIELTVSNTDSSLALTTTDTLNITVSSNSLNFVTPATVKRLLPGQQAVVQVGVTNKAGVSSGTTCSAIIEATWGQNSGKAKTTSTSVNGTCGFVNYTANSSSISYHQAPDWYSNAKYGIFIHWGLYSCPAYGSVAPNEDYAEWYWKRQHDGPTYKTQTYQYHEQTYGTNFNYDDFMSNFTASKFNATEWLDLFTTAGARYFVPVTKHHDGFALFKTPATSSNRNSVNYGPKRDFLNELFATAKVRYPNLRRGTYFSLPEWYHPDYKKYAITWGGGFPGGPPTNPYTGATIPYTGYVQVNDFVQDVQYPEMQTLAYDYDTEIMWCDIGGANNSPQMISDWLNWARRHGRQVTFNSRCGLSGDFDTPEYSTNQNTVVRKWESNRGMDSFSFGYNYMTPDSSYLKGVDIVRSLVDIVSKNGNFLLDIGPKNDGSIPAIMVQGLTDAGKWIHAHAESIFDTRFWQTTSGTGNFRYTTTQDAFYVHYMTTPETTINIPDRIPYISDDKVTIIGGSMHGAVVPSTLGGNGLVTLSLTNAMIQADQYVWTFKITY